MCRLLYLPSKVRPKRVVLIEWLESLIASQGGDGNGLATLRGGVVKGLSLDAEQCADLILASRGAALWHTRAVSSGIKSDDLCHPFDTGHGWLAHNGHWHQGAFAAKLFQGSWSDTAIAAYWIELYGWDSFCRECRVGVWLHLTPRGLQVLYCSGSLYVESRTGALCSEPTRLWGDWQPVRPGAYQAGERPKTEPIKLWPTSSLFPPLRMTCEQRRTTDEILRNL